MTEFERQQDRIVFFYAGQKAFRLGVYFQDNPYKEEPFRGQWERGWRFAQRKFNETRRNFRPFSRK
jgi:hypothetical protein